MSSTPSRSGSTSTTATWRRSPSTADLLALAREIRDGVRDRFGVQLAAEPVFVGCSL